MAAVCLKHEHLLEVFSRRVINVLTEQSDKSIPLSKFVTAYEKLCNHKLRVQNFGFASLEDMLLAVSPVVKVLKILMPCSIFIKLKKKLSLWSCSRSNYRCSGKLEYKCEANPLPCLFLCVDAPQTESCAYSVHNGEIRCNDIGSTRNFKPYSGLRGSLGYLCSLKN